MSALTAYSTGTRTDTATCVHLPLSSAIYYASTSFPAVLRAGLRVIKLGTSSVTYEIGLFSLPPGSSGLQGDAKAAVVTQATHVFVDRTTRRPGPMPTQLREGLEKLVVKESKL